MNCSCYNHTSETHTLKIRKGNTINLRLRYTINDKQPTEEEIRNTRVYIINPYNQKREIHNFKPNENNELELSLTESILGKYSIELAYIGETNQATYDFENVFKIVAKSSEESDLSDSELINKEVNLSGHLSIGYDREVINEINKRLTNLESNTNTSECDCEQIKRDITSMLSDIGRLQSNVSSIEQSTLGLDDVLSEINTDIRDLKYKVSVAPTNKNLQDLIQRVTILENGSNVRPQPPTPQPATPVPDVSAPLIVIPGAPTPTPPNNDGGNDRYDRTPVGPFDHDSVGGYIPDWVERVDEFDTTGDEEI